MCREGGGNSYRELGIYVRARVMGNLRYFDWVMSHVSEFGPRYRSDFQKFASVIGKCRHFIAIFNYYDSKFRKKEFSCTNDTKLILFTVLVVNSALFMGSYFRNLPWLWGHIFKILPWLSILALNSQRHIYTRPPIRVPPLDMCPFISSSIDPNYTNQWM